MKKVLLISSLYYPHVGGIERTIADLARFYRDKGIDAVVLTKKWPVYLSDTDEHDGVKIYRIASARLKDEFEGVVDWIKVNGSVIKSDIIHVIGIRRPMPLIGLLLARLWKVPLMCTIAGGDIPDKIDPAPLRVWEEGRGIVPESLKQADEVNCVSLALVRDIKAQMPGLARVRLLYAGTDISFFKGIKAVVAKRPYIFSLRRLDPSKGIDILIKAFNLIKKTFPDLDLIIAGEGPEEKKLKELAGSFRLNNRVKFIGTVEFKRGISLLKGAELAVVPSLSEGGGLVNLEAQASGCPIVASRVGGIPEYLRENESGVLFEPGNPDDLADKILTLLSSKDLRGKISKGGLEYVKRFDWELLVSEYIHSYARIIESYDKNKEFKPWSGLTAGLWSKLNS
jgi:glycosyltransferase involved in cell wall biosynthesis